jgi:FG-GAP-like repeat
MRKLFMAVGLTAIALVPSQISRTAQAGTGVNRKSVDFNGDGKSDYVVVRNTGGGAGGQITFYTSALGVNSQVAWGLATDSFVPCDFDGDGKDDKTVWRPGPATVAKFYILQSNDNTVREELFGQTGDEPSVSADYDGDGKCDPAVYRKGAAAGQQSYFYYRGSLNNPLGNVTYVPWGLNGDSGTTGDYDGDGKWDFAVQRGGVFWIKTAAGSEYSIPFGLANDFIIRGDYDGDGKSDLAVRRTIAGLHTYFIRQSSDGFVRYGLQWGAPGFNSVPGDYDGDGKTDLAAWLASTGTFWIQNSSNGVVSTFLFGANGDYPIASSQVT